MKEPNSRIIIDKLLRESDWILYGDEGVVNVDTEMQNEAGFAGRQSLSFIERLQHLTS